MALPKHFLVWTNFFNFSKNRHRISRLLMIWRVTSRGTSRDVFSIGLEARSRSLFPEPGFLSRSMDGARHISLQFRVPAISNQGRGNCAFLVDTLKLRHVGKVRLRWGTGQPGGTCTRSRRCFPRRVLSSWRRLHADSFCGTLLCCLVHNSAENLSCGSKE